MKGIRCFPRIVIFLLLLNYIPLHAAPDPCELQQVADEIRKSFLRDRNDPISEIEQAVWDIADGMPIDGLKQLFPKKCHSFGVKGSLQCGTYIVRT